MTGADPFADYTDTIVGEASEVPTRRHFHQARSVSSLTAPLSPATYVTAFASLIVLSFLLSAVTTAFTG